MFFRLILLGDFFAKVTYFQLLLLIATQNNKGNPAKPSGKRILPQKIFSLRNPIEKNDLLKT